MQQASGKTFTLSDDVIFFRIGDDGLLYVTFHERSVLKASILAERQQELLGAQNEYALTSATEPPDIYKRPIFGLPGLDPQKPAGHS